jgi:predicted Zn-dependent protease
MADMQSRQQLQTTKPPNIDMDLIQAMMSSRARVLALPGVDVMRAWAKEASDANLEQMSLTKRMGILYGGFMSLVQLRDFAKAKEMLPRLQIAAGQHAPALRQLKLLEADLAFKEDDFRGVINALSGTANLAHSSWPRAELIYLAQASARLQVSKPAPDTALLLTHASSALQTFVLSNLQDAQAWQVLATALAAQGRPLASLRAEGETQLARMDVGAAVDRFRAAQDAARKALPQNSDHIEASIIDARLRFAQGLLKEQLLERQER